MVETETLSEKAENGEESPVDLSAEDAIHIAIETLPKVQQRRMLGFRRLQEAFLDMIRSGEEHAYRLEMVQLTSEFNECSEEVRGIILMLTRVQTQSESSSSLAEELKQIQELERERLRYSLIIHALRKKGSEGVFSWQTNSPASEHIHLEEGRFACAPEPTEEEFNGAMREATQNLDTITTDLNERLQELYLDYAA